MKGIAKIVVIINVDVVLVGVANKHNLVIGGLVPLTTIDFPDHLSAVIFCQGCPFNCVYCHNKSLIPKYKITKYTWEYIEHFLYKRKNFIEAVVFSGGEPTLQSVLLDNIITVKNMGFKVGLHTAGCYPLRLQRLLPYLDWVGMDIKAPFEQYENITKVPNSGKLVIASAKILVASGIKYEFRTTVDPKLLSKQQLMSIVNSLNNLGATNYKLQKLQNYSR